MSLSKIKSKINQTKKTLKQYGCTFKEYMKDAGRRDDIDLGDKISTKSGEEGIVVGWNNSCNYNVFLFTRNDIYNVHPNGVMKIDEGLNNGRCTEYYLFEMEKRKRAMIFFSRFKEAHSEDEKINIFVDMMTHYDKINARNFADFCIDIYQDRTIQSIDCKLKDKIQELCLIINKG